MGEKQNGYTISLIKQGLIAVLVLLPSLIARASITFPPDLYETLEEIAQQKKVSLAWVVREAAEMPAQSRLIAVHRSHVIVASVGRCPLSVLQKENRHGCSNSTRYCRAFRS